MPGPTPRREDQLARPRSRKGGDQQKVTKGVARPLAIDKIEPDEDWHPIARMLWDGCLSSGQVEYYQDSDIAMLYSLCEDLSHYKSNQYKRSGQMLQAIYSQMERLLVTEGDRRRVRIELQAPEPEQQSAALVAIDGYRKALGVAE